MRLERIGILSPTDFKARLDRGDRLAVLDVRENDERDYAAIALPEGNFDLHIPMGDVTGRFEEIKKAAEGRPLVIYCHHGQRSSAAGTWLVNQGLSDVYNLESGIEGWSQRIDSLVPRY